MTTAQEAPFPDELVALVSSLTYKPRWRFTLDPWLDRGQGSAGVTLVIRITTPDSYAPDINRSVLHYMPVPPAAFDRRSWQRWLLEQILLVERHEACEFFAVAGTKPYAPSHGPGSDPYLVREVGTDEDVRTSYLGAVKPAEPSTTTVETP